jgi:hypothetical protein
MAATKFAWRELKEAIQVRRALQFPTSQSHTPASLALLQQSLLRDSPATVGWQLPLSAAKAHNCQASSERTLMLPKCQSVPSSPLMPVMLVSCRQMPARNYDFLASPAVNAHQLLAAAASLPTIAAASGVALPC